MTSFNTFKENFRDTVLASTTVSSLIDTRFYGAHLATLFHSPTSTTDYPLATFNSESGDEDAVHQDFIITVKSYSQIHFDEAHDVFASIYEVLRSCTISPRVTIRAIGNPTEMFDEISRLYSVTGRFRTVRILDR